MPPPCLGKKFGSLKIKRQQILEHTYPEGKSRLASIVANGFLIRFLFTTLYPLHSVHWLVHWRWLGVLHPFSRWPRDTLPPPLIPRWLRALLQDRRCGVSDANPGQGFLCPMTTTTNLGFVHAWRDVPSTENGSGTIPLMCSPISLISPTAPDATWSEIRHNAERTRSTLIGRDGPSFLEVALADLGLPSEWRWWGNYLSKKPLSELDKHANFFGRAWSGFCCRSRNRERSRKE